MFHRLNRTRCSLRSKVDDGLDFFIMDFPLALDGNGISGNCSNIYFILSVLLMNVYFFCFSQSTRCGISDLLQSVCVCLCVSMCRLCVETSYSLFSYFISLHIVVDGFQSNIYFELFTSMFLVT